MPASRRRSISPPTEKVKPTLAHKNFAGAIPSGKATTPIKNFRVFSCLFVVKKWVVGVSPRQACSCGSWLKSAQVTNIANIHTYNKRQKGFDHEDDTIA